MKNLDSKPAVIEVANSDEHDLFHLLKRAEKIKVSADIPVKEELTNTEQEVFNFLLNLNKDFPHNNDEFTLELLMNTLDLKITEDDLVDIFRNLDKKYYTECAFDDEGRFVWIKLV